MPVVYSRDMHGKIGFCCMLTKPNSLEREKYFLSNAPKIIGIGPVVLEIGPFEISPKCLQIWPILQRDDSSGFGPVLKKNLLAQHQSSYPTSNGPFSKLRKSWELRFHTLGQLLQNFLKFGKSYVDFPYFGPFRMSNFKQTVLQD